MSLTRVSPEEAHIHMCEQGASYVDVRTVAEFDAGHPEGAYNVPWQVPGPHGLVENPSFLQEMRATFGTDELLVVGCASGVRSLAAAQALLGAGFSHVVEQRGGYDGVRDPFGGIKERGWQELGLPCAWRAQAGRDHASIQRKCREPDPG